jgi:uncharacterized protein YcaQ
MLEKQGIGKQSQNVNRAHIYTIVDNLGCLQIDTINVIERAHYLTLWTRLGLYDKEHLNTLVYKDRLLFEYYAHSACYIPFNDYRYYIRSMNLRKEEIKTNFIKWSKTNPDMLDKVLKRIQEEGPLSSKDFEGPKLLGGWWNWKPAKIALELLFGAGVLLIERRENFQKYYDLAENVLPKGIDTVEPSENERARYFMLKTMSCLGLVKPTDFRLYYQPRSIKQNLTPRQFRRSLDELVSEDDVVKFNVEEEKEPYYCLPEDKDRLEVLNSDLEFDEVRLFVYFDNMMWNRERIKDLFGFICRLETYVSKDKRVYGYYHLPVLYGENLVARVEPKMDRKNNVLIIRGYWVEDGFTPTEHFENELSRSLDSFAEFHGTEVIEWNT